MRNPSWCNVIPIIFKQTGVTLVEIMTSILVLAIGMLGLAALQTTSLRLSNDSASRSQSEFLAYDFVDRARANPTAPDYTIASALSNPETNCYTTSCTPEQMRTHDLYLWQEQVKNTFSDVKTATVKYNAADNLYTLTLKWDDRYVGDELNASDAIEKKFEYKFRIAN